MVEETSVSAPEEVTIWGPAEPKKHKSLGFGDVVLSLILFFILPALPLVLFAANAKPNQTSGTATEAVTKAVTTGPALAVALLVSWIGLLAPSLWAAFRKDDRNWRRVIRWGFNPRVDLTIAVFFTLGFRIVETIFSQILEWLGADTKELGNTGFITEQTGIWLVLIGLLAAFGAPVAEELFFRGVFLTAALKRFGPATSVVITSVVFGLLHAQGGALATAVTVSQTGIIGAILAVLVLKTNRIGTSIATHVLFNASGVVLAALFS